MKDPCLICAYGSHSNVTGLTPTFVKCCGDMRMSILEPERLRTAAYVELLKQVQVLIKAYPILGSEVALIMI